MCLGSLMAILHDQPTARITVLGTTLRVMATMAHLKHLMDNAAQLNISSQVKRGKSSGNHPI
jgi:hypothetical protein